MYIGLIYEIKYIEYIGNEINKYLRINIDKQIRIDFFQILLSWYSKSNFIFHIA